MTGGNATIDGTATLEFGSAASTNVSLSDSAIGVTVSVVDACRIYPYQYNLSNEADKISRDSLKRLRDFSCLDGTCLINHENRIPFLPGQKILSQFADFFVGEVGFAGMTDIIRNIS